MIHALYIYLIIGAFLSGFTLSCLELELRDILIGILMFLFWPFCIAYCLLIRLTEGKKVH
jgi:hypothetical protein